MTYNYTITKRIITSTTNENYISGNTTDTATFSFDSEWNGLIKTVRFQQGMSNYDIILENDSCTVPCLAFGRVCIGIFAGNLHTSNILTELVQASIISYNGLPSNPPSNVYAQIIELLEETVQNANDALAAANNAIATANLAAANASSSANASESSSEIASQAAISASQAATSAVNASDAALEAERLVSIAKDAAELASINASEYASVASVASQAAIEAKNLAQSAKDMAQEAQSAAEIAAQEASEYRYTLPIADSTTLGGVKPIIQNGNTINPIAVDTQGKLYSQPELLPIVVSNLSEKAEKIRKAQSTKTLSLSLTSDSHYHNTEPLVIQALSYMSVMKQYSIIDAIANLGDLTPGAYAKDTTIEYMSNVLSSMKRYLKSPIFMARGNHDNNYEYSDSAAGTYQIDEVINSYEWCQQIFDATSKDIIIDASNPFGGYGYYDDEKSKIRVFILNTEDIPYIIDGTTYRYVISSQAFSNFQLNFVKTALMFSDKDVPNDWASLFLMHHPFDTQNDIGYRFGIGDAPIRGIEVMLGIINAYKNGSSFVFTGSVYNSSLGDQSSDFNVSVSCDYSSKGQGDVIAFVSGHTHTDNFSKEIGYEVSQTRGYLFIGVFGNDGFQNLVFDRQNNLITAIKYGTVVPDNTGVPVGTPDSGSISSGTWTMSYSQFRPNEQNLYRGLDPDGDGYTFGSSDTTLNLSTLVIKSRDAYAAYKLTKAIPVNPLTVYKIPSDFVGIVCAYTDEGTRSAFLTPVSADGYKTITTTAAQYYLVFAFHLTYTNQNGFTLFPLIANSPNLFNGFDSNGAGYLYGESDKSLNISTLEVNSRSASANYYLSRAIPVKPFTKYRISSGFVGLCAAYGIAGNFSLYLTPSSADGYKIITTAKTTQFLVFAFHTPGYNTYRDFQITEDYNDTSENNIDNRYTTSEKDKLVGIADNANNYTLPIATPTVLGGVQPVAKTSDMTQSVGVDASGALFTAAGGTWRMLNTVTLTSDVANIYCDSDLDGNSFAVSEILVIISGKSVTNGNLQIRSFGLSQAVNGISLSTTENRTNCIFIKPLTGMGLIMLCARSLPGVASSQNGVALPVSTAATNTTTSINLWNITFASGCIVSFYGKD